MNLWQDDRVKDKDAILYEIAKWIDVPESELIAERR